MYQQTVLGETPTVLVPGTNLSLTPDAFALHILELLVKLEGHERRITYEAAAQKALFKGCDACKAKFAGVTTVAEAAGRIVTAANDCDPRGTQIPSTVDGMRVKRTDGSLILELCDLTGTTTESQTDFARRLVQSGMIGCACNQKVLPYVQAAHTMVKTAATMTDLAIGTDWRSLVLSAPSSTTTAQRLLVGKQIVIRLRRLTARQSKQWYQKTTYFLVQAQQTYDKGAKVSDAVWLSMYNARDAGFWASVGGMVLGSWEVLINGLTTGVQFVARTAAELTVGTATGLLTGLFKGAGPAIGVLVLLIGGYYGLKAYRRRSTSAPKGE